MKESAVARGTSEGLDLSTGYVSGIWLYGGQTGDVPEITNVATGIFECHGTTRSPISQ